jgi:hypothetical protein
MTVSEIYEQGVKDLPAFEQLRLASLILERLTGTHRDGELRGKIQLATPPNEQLLALAAVCAPPQGWWDETDDPTTPMQEK